VEISYYDTLGISKEATEGEIKKAYVIKLRQYPNEKFPEEFKEIRKAYEILSNPKTRKEFDTMSIYGDEIKQLQSDASESLNNQDFEAAINCYKKILMIEPSLLNVRNQYALALIYHEEYNKAIKQLEKLVEQENDNAVYMFNLGFAYERKGNKRQAITYYQLAYELDPNDVNIIFALTDVYVDLKEYQNARNAITNALAKSSNEGFHQFMYLFRHLQIDVFAKDFKEIEKTLKKIESLLADHPDEKSYVAIEFGKFAAELFDYKQFTLAYYLTEKGVELDPTNTALIELHEDTKDRKVLYGEFELLEKDERILKPLGYNLFLYLFGNEFSKKEYQEHLDTMYKNIELSAIYEPNETISSLKRINIKYPNLYKEREEFFNEVMKMSEKNKEINNQYERLKNDSLITNSLVRLMALYLSNFEEDERRSYFEDIMNEMGHEPASKVLSAINRIQSSYPALFAINSEFLKDIKKTISENNQSNSYSSSSSSSNSYSSSSSSSSCFVATAAYGSPLMAELDYLRFWRDNYLRKSVLGRKFIIFYYRFGPNLAIPVTHSSFLKKHTQKLIKKIIQYIDKKHGLVNQYYIQKGPTQKKVSLQREG
jgi:curved DNA-binding protein CbpA